MQKTGKNKLVDFMREPTMYKYSHLIKDSTVDWGLIDPGRDLRRSILLDYTEKSLLGTFEDYLTEYDQVVTTSFNERLLIPEDFSGQPEHSMLDLPFVFGSGLLEFYYLKVHTRKMRLNKSVVDGYYERFKNSEGYLKLIAKGKTHWEDAVLWSQLLAYSYCGIEADGELLTLPERLHNNHKGFKTYVGDNLKEGWMPDINRMIIYQVVNH